MQFHASSRRFSKRGPLFWLSLPLLVVLSMVTAAVGECGGTEGTEPPQWAYIPPVDLVSGGSVSFDLDDYVFDADTADSDLDLEVSGGSSSSVAAALNETSHVLTLTAAGSFAGQVSFLLSAVDPEGNSAQASFLVTVTQAVASSIAFTSIVDGGTYTNPVTFKVRASSDIKTVRYVSIYNGREYAIGESTNSSQGFPVTYTFSTTGTRDVYARGYNSGGTMVAEDGATIQVNNGAVVCYLGPNRDDSVCYELDPMSSPPPSGYEYPSSCESSYGSTYKIPDHLLDLYTTDENDYVAPNFQLGEFVQEYKGQYAVLQAHAVDSMQGLRDALGPIVINSGYRSPAYNTSVDGATCSRHMYGDAFDMVASNVSLTTLANTCYDHGAGYVGVYDTFIHCDWRHDTLDAAYYRTLDPGELYDDLPELEASLVYDEGRWFAPARGWDEGEPLRQWTAYDRDGRILVEATGQSFVAPDDAFTVDVVVGAEIWLRQHVPAHR